MKKKFLITSSAIILLGGLTAGVFAKYQTKLDDVAGSVTAKKWLITAEATDYQEGAVKLAPGESVKVLTYTIKNDSEVDAKISGTYTIEGNLAEQLNTTFSGTNADGWDINGSTYSNELAQGSALTFNININWSLDEDDVDNNFSEKQANWSISFMAVQA